MSLYIVLAFENIEDANKFIETMDMELPKERKMVPIDWNELTSDDVEYSLQEEIFDGVYDYFVFCEIEFEDIKLVEISNKKMMAG